MPHRGRTTGMYEREGGKWKAEAHLLQGSATEDQQLAICFPLHFLGSLSCQEHPLQPTPNPGPEDSVPCPQEA